MKCHEEEGEKKTLDTYVQRDILLWLTFEYYQ